MTARPRVATVLSAREWESNLVQAARATSAVRLVARAYEPGDVAKGVDVVVAGAETSWVTPACIKRWHMKGVRVLGLHPAGDAPAKRMLERAAADEIRPDTTSPVDLVHIARMLGLDRRAPRTVGRLVVVAGPHGAPGRTEVAVTLAQVSAPLASTLLLDLDIAAPSISMRLGLPPTPSLGDVEDEVLASGEIPDHVVHRSGALAVVVGDLRRSPSAFATDDIVTAATRRAEIVVVDTGARAERSSALREADAAVLVCDASPTGLIRGAEMALRWEGPAPRLVLNRLGSRIEDTVIAARRAIGLEPAAMIPDTGEIRAAALSARPSPASLRTAMGGLVQELFEPDLGAR